MLPLLLLSTFVAILASPAGADKFVLGGAGSAFQFAPPGYVEASLADLSSAEFLSVYNANGLRDQGEHMPSGWCPLIAVREGVVAFNVEGTGLQLFAPFGTNRKLQSGHALVNPVWFGDLSGTGWSVQSFIGPLSAAKAASIAAVAPPLSLSCDFALAHFAVFIRATFVLGGYGGSFPPAPTATAVLCTLEDVRSNSFLSQYNANGLSIVPGAQNLGAPGCCVIRVADNGGSFAAIFTSPLGPWFGNGTSQCADGVNPAPSGLDAPVWFGTGPWGSSPSQFVGPLNFTSESQLDFVAGLPPNCSDAVDAWALFKDHPRSGPPPNDGACFEMSLQASYYEPSNGMGPCLADRWRFYMRLNETYPEIAMSSFDTCGGANSLYGMSIAPYNGSWLVATTTGATGCNCSNGTYTNTALLPMNASARSGYTTVCDVRVGEFGFCMVEIGVTSGPMKCP